MLHIPPRGEARRHPITTKRLALAPIESSDADELFQAVEISRAHLEKWLPWVPFNVDEPSTRIFVEACESDWDMARACRLVVRNRATHNLLGVIGLELLNHLHESAELGYWLRVDATGQGFMAEAGRAVLTWAFGKLGVHRVRIAAATDNHASLRVIGRLGFHFEGIARKAERVQGRFLDHAVFALLSADVTL